jgi:hypothetical protein
MNKYDIIGDIHGHAERLTSLLLKLGYESTHGLYTHPDRKVLYVGDYIDRGPKIKETLQIVKTMVDHGHAIALMGNHEYNAICYNTVGTDGQYLRSHTVKNMHQHQATLDQFNGYEEEYAMYIDWFKTLPLWMETNDLRAIHATWDQPVIDRLSELLPDALLTDQAIQESSVEGTELYNLIEVALKGKEIEMPAGQHFNDKDGHKRHHIRIKWWLDPASTTYRDISVIPMDDKLPETPVMMSDTGYYRSGDKPVFFGHYWLKGEPVVQTDNVCCLDYSVAKGGQLVAYIYNGEQKLDASKLSYL